MTGIMIALALMIAAFGIINVKKPEDMRISGALWASCALVWGVLSVAGLRSLNTTGDKFHFVFTTVLCIVYAWRAFRCFQGAREEK